MSDASFGTPEQQQQQQQSSQPQHTGTAKPRLSLMASKQSGIRLKSEDQPDQRITILSSAPEDYAKIVNANSGERQPEMPHHITATTTTTAQKEVTNPQVANVSERESPRINGNTQNNDENKMNISKEDLIRLLTMLKSELQSKEIALAAIKCEQLKRLINPIEISRSSLANTYVALQERFKQFDQNNNNNKKVETQSPTKASNEDPQGQEKSRSKSVCNKTESQEDDSERESLNILNTLLELLDRHPLLALPRDSIYCLDYNCNELSTKNYLNLKIQHLDNLINQHRRFRYYMNERLKRSEQRCQELSRELELERSLKFENEKMLYKTSGKATLLKHIDQLKETLEKEKQDKETIVMTLLNELLDERERVESLQRKLAINAKSDSRKATRENMSEKEVLMEVELLETYNTALKKQTAFYSEDNTILQTRVSVLKAENANLKADLAGLKAENASLKADDANLKMDDASSKAYDVSLKAENASLKAKLEQLEKRLALLSRSSVHNEAKDSSSSGTNSSPSKTNVVLNKQNTPLNKQASSTNAPAVVTRNSISSTAATKTPPVPKASPSNSSSGAQNTQQGKNLAQNSNTSTNGGNNQASSNMSRPGVNNSSSSNNQRTTAPPIVSRSVSGCSTEHAPVKIQPLFKSASVLSTNQQVRNLSKQNSVSANSSSRYSTNTNQPVTKPQVPAKPAQLLDQQRNSLS